MWKILQHITSDRQAGLVDNSTFFETTIDEKVGSRDRTADLGIEPNTAMRQHVGTVGRPSSGNQPLYPPRPPRKQIPPSIPFHQMAFEGQELAVKPPKIRPASSIYSQPSPNLPNQRFVPSRPAPKISDFQSLEISPPSSPDLSSFKGARSHQYYDSATSRGVSPISEHPSYADFRMESPPPRIVKSSIPILRREKRKHQAAAAAAETLARKESVRQNKGTPNGGQQEDSANPPPNTSSLGQVDGWEVGTTTTISSSAPRSFSDRMRMLKVKSPLLASRPDWKGASGRDATVPPVSTDFSISPLRMARKNGGGAKSPEVGDSGNGIPISELLLPPIETLDVSPTLSDSSIHAMRPVIPTRRGSAAFAASPISPDFNLPQRSPKAAYDELPSQRNYITIPGRGSSNFSGTQSPRNIPQSTSDIERGFYEALNGVDIGGLPSPRGSSRSSLTYPTSAKAESPGLDHSWGNQSQRAQTQSSILSRHRPRISISSIDSPSHTTRKPMPPKYAVEGPIKISLASTSSPQPQRSVTSSGAMAGPSQGSWKDLLGAKEKTLPMTPSEAATEIGRGASPSTSLQVRVDSLSRRRYNLEKSIFQMTELMPQSSAFSTHVTASAPITVGGKTVRGGVVDGRWVSEDDLLRIRKEEVRLRREDEKRKVESLREELADVKKEEHELGLKLCRARRREEERAVFTPTSMWVRSATG